MYYNFLIQWFTYNIFTSYCTEQHEAHCNAKLKEDAWLHTHPVSIHKKYPLQFELYDQYNFLLWAFSKIKNYFNGDTLWTCTMYIIYNVENGNHVFLNSYISICFKNMYRILYLKAYFTYIILSQVN